MLDHVCATACPSCRPTCPANPTMHRHKHKCVLDRMCAPPNTGNVAAVAENFNFAAPLYFLALLQKVTWALEVRGKVW